MLVHLKRFAKIIFLLFAACIGSALFLLSGLTNGMIVLLFAMSLAIVGEGNRILWTAIFPLFFILLAILSHFSNKYLSDMQAGNWVASLIAIALIPLGPAIVLWAAHTIQLKRRRKHSQN